MNIFYLDPDPRNAARMHCDKHVRKMIVEYAQLLSTAHYCCNSRMTYQVYKPAYINHPSTRWVRYCSENYIWLERCFQELLRVYNKATGKTHKTFELAHLLMLPPRDLPFATAKPNCKFQHTIPNISPIPQCMPDTYKRDGDAVTAYRLYYCHAKSAIAQFTYNEMPVWYYDDVPLSDERSAYLTDVSDSLYTSIRPAPLRKPRNATQRNATANAKPRTSLKPAISSLSQLITAFT